MVAISRRRQMQVKAFLDHNQRCKISQFFASFLWIIANIQLRFRGLGSCDAG